MRYFVIAEDGQKYGPADVPTLQTWINEGRLMPTQQVEEEGSGMRMAAAAVNGLQFAAPQQPMGAPQQPGGIPTGNPYSAPVGTYVSSGDDGKTDVIIAWVFAALGVVFCLLGIILQPVALVFASRALNKGNSGGNAVKIFSIIFLILSIIALIFYITVFKSMMSNPAFQPGQQPPFRPN